MSDLAAQTLARTIINKIPEVESTPLEGNKIELKVPVSKIRDVVIMIDEQLADAFPETIHGVDLQEEKYELIYIFWSYSNRLLCQLRVALEGESPEIETVSDIFPGLEWYERETHEMFGINFLNHPDLRLLLLPDELEGKYPLRKSFQPDRSRLSESGLPQRRPRPRRGGASK